MLRVPENVRSRHSREGGIVLDILHGQMFRLNFVGSRILELLQQGCAESEIVEQLAQDFRIDQATVEADVREFVELLMSHHLLTVHDDYPIT